MNWCDTHAHSPDPCSSCGKFCCPKHSFEWAVKEGFRVEREKPAKAARVWGPTEEPDVAAALKDEHAIFLWYEEEPFLDNGWHVAVVWQEAAE